MAEGSLGSPGSEGCVDDYLGSRELPHLPARRAERHPSLFSLGGWDLGLARPAVSVRLARLVSALLVLVHLQSLGLVYAVPRCRDQA